MKILLILFTFFTLGFSEHVFMLDRYDKEIELEAKMIYKIAKDVIKKGVKIHIPDISKKEKEVYSKYFTLTQDCSTANFIFDKKGYVSRECISDSKVYFTNNYRRFISNSRYFGAFFWNKSRPNIVFAKKRIEQKDIKLPYEYKKYIEDIDD
jgi:hypothetical protein